MGKLDSLDLTLQLDREDYRRHLGELQLDLVQVQQRLRKAKRNVVMVFEGPDAAGKGGVIKRITEKLDPRLIRVWNIVKPTQEEYAHHYLWRFWNRLPSYGEMVIFDRSWYGRLLVERVEGFATEEEWKRAYGEINEFERTLVDDGTIMVKFYLHIGKDEQLRRFEKRAADPYKNWKMSEEDWRNRRKWKQHVDAAEAMFEMTSTKGAPWHLIEGNQKWYARVKVLEVLSKTFKREL